MIPATSDFSYLQRDAQEIYLTAFLLMRMWQVDGLKCLSPRRVINGELRSIVTWFMFLLMIAQASWDFLCTYIKYTEGFMQVAPGVIISKPFEAWSPSNQNPIEVMNYIQCVTFSLQVSILLLLQCFWNYLSNAVAKHTFMSSREFTFYIVWTIGTIAMFPILQYFYKHTSLEEVVPQTAYSCERNGKKKDRQVTSRLAYFRDMNLLLSVALVAFGGGMFILCIDGFTTNKVINSHKFAADLLICNTNISSIFLWLIIIGIFHPARVAVEGTKKTTEGTATKDTPIAPHGSVKTTFPNDNDAPISPPGRYFDTYNNSKELYRTESTRALNAHNDTELDYMPPSSPNEEFSPGGRRQQPLNVVSINDPFGKESVSFSMINPNNTNKANNTLSYASAVDYYGVNSANRSTLLSASPPPPPPPFTSPSLDLRSTTASPPPDQDLPPVPASVSSMQNHHYYHAV
ncbi:hypothetical protein [Absidia glauca]|uniref:Uncharacterized protein n=1 Tax=Absidia glauca TaxID=4829 RepID=A0A168QBA8_ABSGL|nr:hypothetical protein [Absidia glauca]